MAIYAQVPCFARAATEDGARSMESLGWMPAGFGADKLWMQGALVVPEQKVMKELLESKEAASWPRKDREWLHDRICQSEAQRSPLFLAQKRAVTVGVPLPESSRPTKPKPKQTKCMTGGECRDACCKKELDVADVPKE